jgi:hypothetical protein
MGREAIEAAANSMGVWAATWVGVDDGQETATEEDVADGDRAAAARVWGGGSLSFKPISFFLFQTIFDVTMIYMESETPCGKNQHATTCRESTIKIKDIGCESQKRQVDFKSP